jgi:hypothetical protein
MMRLLATVLMSGALLACQSPLPLSSAKTAAIRSHNVASKALAEGDVPAAEAGFREAMRQAAALDDWAGEAESRLAWAVSLQRRGQGAEAERALAPLLDDLRLPYPLASQQQALAWRAQWQLTARNWPALEQDLLRLSNLCAKECRPRALLASLQAQLAVHEKRLADAAGYAERALALAGTEASETRAYALRVQANIALLDKPEQGIAPIMAALDIDRQLGNSAGIFQDLLLRTWLAQLLQAPDRTHWLHRTCQVAAGMQAPINDKTLQQLPEELWHEYFLSFAASPGHEPVAERPAVGIEQRRCRSS